MTNPLIEGETATSALQGTKVIGGLAKTATAYGTAFTSEPFSFLDAGVATATTALDVLSFVANPFKHLLQAGVGWLFEHISFLREPLDWVAGNPQAIEGLALTWNNIAMEMSTAADEWAAELKTIEDWDGADATAYRNAAAGFEQVLRSSAEAAATTANGVNIAGVAVGILRTIILELITNFIAEAIMWALSALATAGFTFGATLAAAIARIVSKAVSVFANIVGKVGQLMSKFGRYIASFRRFGTQSQGLKKAMDATTDQLLKGSSKAFMNGGRLTMNGAGNMRNASLDTLRKSFDPLKNNWGNPINTQKVLKYSATEINRGRNLDDRMEQERKDNGGP
ncbi:hypothetical protein O1R50_01810 [Glycomyces luteolus]|uniref:Outer membrane channel protein CpnT-like N-terminal domain-containing protein n=1 Tax=Glycomyces luteolus TaxID=2670330 RepID=A0A9X3P7T2_9ACTN|nr:hypothetical protein [Glycomyces luteolus]MDA1358335.1 hypothetical protein [Glycomyces luteolus]